MQQDGVIVGRSIPTLFRAQAAGTPSAIALIWQGGQISYGELDARSDRLARVLMARGAGPGCLVGTLLERSVDAVVALLAILKSGAAFVPFDPDYPPRMLAGLVRDARPVTTLVQRSALVRSALDAEALGDFLFVDDAPEATTDAPWPEPAADDPAYVMFTSGSTGRPKGVVVPHRGVVRLVRETNYASFADETFLQLAPLSFDASTLEVWGPLLNGGRLAIAPPGKLSLDDIAEAIRALGVTSLWLTAGLFHLMVDHAPGVLAGLRQLFAGGDVLSPRHVASLQALAPDLQIINGYGPTENTTFTCCWRVAPGFAGDAALPIGHAITGTTLHVLDEQMNPVAPGQPGQLAVGGQGVALGYLNRAEQTAAAFIPDRFAAQPGALLYLTGDVVRQRPDGALEFHGRADRQIKINGKRVELDEVENVLRGCGLVADGAVTAYQAGEGLKRIIAHVALKPDAPITDAPIIGARLRSALLALLPDHMVPSEFVVLERLPLTATGKLDRRALPPPAVAAPATTGEGSQALLLALWRDALHRNDVGLDANFFDLGGTSLQLVAVHARLREACARDLPITELFRLPTIRALADWLDAPPDRAAPGPMDAARARAHQQMAAMRRMRPRPFDGQKEGYVAP